MCFQAINMVANVDGNVMERDDFKSMGFSTARGKKKIEGKKKKTLMKV